MIPANGFRKFFLSIVVPTIIAIGLFIISIYLVLIPAFEKNSMERKQEMIRELTNTAWSLIEEYNQEYKDSVLSLNQAKELAIERISKMRYGNEGKDYFWIIDDEPKMIMHPYRISLIGQNLSDYADPEGTRLFIEAVDLVNENEEGFIHYLWQWKDDSTRIVPKLSYVKEYENWGWILGTGIYLEDVKLEIQKLKRRVLFISSLIILIIIIVLLFLVNQSLKIERKRREAEGKLLLSKQKYKSLVEAATEGTLLIIDERISFCNLKFAQMVQQEPNRIMNLCFDELFEVSWKEVLGKFERPDKSINIETRFRIKGADQNDIVISISKVKYAGRDGFIVVTKDVTRQKQIEIESQHLSAELQTSLSLMNQPIKPFVKSVVKCDLNTTAHAVAAIMTRKKQKAVFVSHMGQVVGVVNEADLRTRLLAKSIPVDTPISQIMSAPVISIVENALLFEAELLIKNERISHLAVTDTGGTIHGVISNADLLEMQRNSLSYYIREIEKAEEVSQLKHIYERVPVLLNALMGSGDKVSNITRIISSVADAINKRVIALAVHELGEPPCSFAFIALGSEGRMEQTLSTDQDNAIIIEDSESGRLDTTHDYFRQFADIVNTNLGQIGYKLCDGEIMARNPKWCQTLSVWKNYFDKWMVAPEPQAVLDASIFFDFKYVYGDRKLVVNLRQHVYQQIGNKAVFFHHMAQSVFKFRPPLGMFGGIKTDSQSGEHNTFDVKKVLLPIVSFIRLYALKHKLDETNSLHRLDALILESQLSKTIGDELGLSYNYLMMLRLKFQITEIKGSLPADNFIDIDHLTEIEITTLKKIFSEIGKLQTTLSNDFNISP